MEVITFYSYKGGVGRTLMLAWLARGLAARGKRVLAIDLDLEAPGLVAKLRPTTEPKPGFGVVDLLLRFQGGATPPGDLKQWCLPVATESGSLWLLPAGNAPSPSYWQALSRVSWEGLFGERSADGARFFLWLRDALAKAVDADFLLIDARTGVTEMGAAAVGLLADTVVAITNMSKESRTGLREVLRAAVGGSRAPGRPVLRVLPILSRVSALLDPVSEAQLADQARQFMNEEADPLTNTLAVERVLVVHHEEILLGDERRAFEDDGLRVGGDYRRVLAWVLGGALPMRTDRSLALAPSILDSIRTQREIVEQYRRSSEIEPEVYYPALVVSLSNLGNDIAQLGHLEEAESAAREAVAICRKLVAMTSGGFLPTLAACLVNLSNRQGENGRREDALVSAAESVEIYRDLVLAGEGEFRSELANGLSVLGVGQLAMGRKEEALASAAQSVEIYREIASDEGGSPRRLAASIANLSNCQRSLGHQKQALETCAQAVAVFRELVERDPSAVPDLAAGLNNLSNCQSENQEYEAALSTIADAVEIRRRLAETQPEVHVPQLASSLTNMATVLGELGRETEALVCAAEATNLLRELAKRRPTSFNSYLGDSLNNEAVTKGRLGDAQSAVELSAEAVEIYSQLFEANAEAFRERLKVILNGYRNHLKMAKKSLEDDPLFQTTAMLLDSSP